MKIYSVDRSTKYFLTRQQCKGNPFLRFPGDTRRFYIVNSSM